MASATSGSCAARAAAARLEAVYCFVHLHICACDPECADPRRGLERAMDELGQIHREMLDDDRLLLLEPDVYHRGPEPLLLEAIPGVPAER